jgi:MFS family permease
MVFIVLASGGGYREGFLVLLAPATIAIAVLVTGYLMFPRPSELEASGEIDYRDFRGAYWLYLASVCFVALGYADFPLIGYHLGVRSVLDPSNIPIIYALAMLTDALSALVSGRYFDRYGFRVMALAVLVSMFYAPLSFLGGSWAAVMGAVLWGVGMGAQESVMRAAVSAFSSPERRGSAYGTFNTIFGVAWFSGSLIMSYLYGLSVPGLVAFSIITQSAALVILLGLEGFRSAG